MMVDCFSKFQFYCSIERMELALPVKLSFAALSKDGIFVAAADRKEFASAYLRHCCCCSRIAVDEARGRELEGGNERPCNR